MDLHEYQEAARETAIYPREHRITYPALGLAEEAGEVTGQLKRYLRDDDGKLTPERISKVSAELGDVLWYIAALCSDLGLNLEVVAKQNLAKLRDRKERKALKGQGDHR